MKPDLPSINYKTIFEKSADNQNAETNKGLPNNPHKVNTKSVKSNKASVNGKTKHESRRMDYGPAYPLTET